MCQVFLAETVETGNIKKRCVIMFCEESLGKIKFRAFPKRVGPRIVSLESVDYFGISEHYWVVGKKKSLRACFHGGGGYQVGEVTRLGGVKK